MHTHLTCFSCCRHITPGTGTDKRCRQAPTGDFSALPVASLMSPQPAEGQHPAANAAAGDQSASEQVGGDQSAAAAQAAASHEIQDATVQQTDARDVLQLGDQTQKLIFSRQEHSQLAEASLSHQWKIPHMKRCCVVKFCQQMLTCHQT